MSNVICVNCGEIGFNDWTRIQLARIVEERVEITVTAKCLKCGLSVEKKYYETKQRYKAFGGK